MKSNSKPLAIFASALVVSLAGAALVGGLKFSVKKGDVLKYKRDFKFKLNGADVEVSGDITAQVQLVDDAGQATIEYSSSNSILKAGDITTPMDSSPLTKVYKSDGTLYSLHGESASPEAYRLETLSSVKLPDTAIAKDFTWTWDVPADKTGVVKSTIVFKVLGDETISGVDSWKLSRSTKELSGDNPITDEGTVWISKANGYLVKSNDAWVNAPIPGAHQTISGTFTYELQP